MGTCRFAERSTRLFLVRNWCGCDPGTLIKQKGAHKSSFFDQSRIIYSFSKKRVASIAAAAPIPADVTTWR